MAAVAVLTLIGLSAEAKAQWPADSTPGWPTYSYYAAPIGVPARVYIGLGTPTDFPFQGQRYGHATDRWSWNSLMGQPDPRLLRYYYPPVR
jgi:hypothetical protein